MTVIGAVKKSKMVRFLRFYLMQRALLPSSHSCHPHEAETMVA